MLGAEAIAETLKSLGVEEVFLFPGGTIAPLLDALVKTGIRYVCTRNEQGAGYAAIGAAKVTGFPQVVIVTSGPGATNVLTPVADAYYDSVPLLVFTGQVSTKDINSAKKVRQTGFQETDTIGIFHPVTKKSYVLTLDEDISNTITDAFLLTTRQRPGPVVIDLPMDVQRGELKSHHPGDHECPIHTDKNGYGSKDMNKVCSKVRESIARSKRPLVIAGNGIYISQCVSEFRSFVEQHGIPVVCTLPGVGVLPSDHPLCFGFIGHTGEYFANLATYHSDLLIALGARLDLRQTGSETSALKENKFIVRVDIDPSELEFGRVKADLDINADLKEFLAQLVANSNIPVNDYSDWIGRMNNWKKIFHSSQFYQKSSLSMYDIIRTVDDATKQKRVVVTSGVGMHQQMVARYFTFDYPSRMWLTSAGHGTMGFDLPAAIGAILHSGEALGIVFVGDGSFQMNIQELATIEEYNLPIKVFVLDNKRLGIVSQFQLLNWNSDPSTGNKKNPSFSDIAKAYGLRGFDIREKTEITSIMKEVFSNPSPAVVHCHVDPSEDVLPMLLAGQKMNEMYPFEREEA